MPAIFLSYAHADAEKALRLYHDLTQAGVEVWLDQESLLPGQRWKPAIENAIRSTRYFVALLSTSSVSRRGYVQKELVIALDVLEEFPSDDIFVIPVRLEECSPSHPKLRDLHWVDLYPDWDRGVTKILKACGAPGEPTHEPSAPTSVAKRASEPQERGPPGARRTPSESDPVQGASARRSASTTLESPPRTNRGPRRWVSIRVVRAILLAITLVVFLPATFYGLWLNTWVAVWGPNKPIRPDITIMFVIGELALATLAGWAATRVNVLSPGVNTAIVASAWLATWIFLGSLLPDGTSGIAYVGLVTIVGSGYTLAGGWISGRMDRNALKVLAAMLVLGAGAPALIWLPKAMAPPPPFELQDTFSVPNLNSIAVSPDGKQLATASRVDSVTHTITLWERRPRAMKRRVRLPASSVHTLRFSSDGQRLMAVGDSGVSCLLFACTGYAVARVWNTQTGRVEAAVTDLQGAWHNRSALSPDAAILATGGFSTLRLWATTSGEMLTEMQAQDQSPEFAPDGKTLATMADSVSVSIWDVTTGRQLRTLRSPRSPITAFAFSPHGILLVTGTRDGAVSVWDARTGRLEKRMLADTALGTVREVMFSPDGRWLASTGDNGIVVLWDTVKGSWSARWNAHYLAFVPDRKSVVTYDGSAFALWDLRTLEWKQGFVAPMGFLEPMPTIEFSADGAVLVTHQATTVAVWLSRVQARHPQGT